MLIIYIMSLPPNQNDSIIITDHQVPGQSQEQTLDICLVMIVKDEEDSIEKCLKSVSPYISYWVIVDTGSSDKTIEKIHEVTNELGIPGELHERPWVNFEVNRTESLELAKGKCDYRWIIDADDEFVLEEGIKNPFIGLDDKTIDCYQLKYKLSGLQYYRAQIVRSDQDWCYKGVLHEYLFLDKEGQRHSQVKGCYVKADISPLKRASSVEEKYAKDAVILEKALEDEPENHRYMFYLAQSYRDSQQDDKAFEAYKKRAEAGGWEEEVYYSMYMMAKIKEKLKAPSNEIIELYSRAWEYRPQRLEAAFHVMRKLREQKRYVLAFAYGNVATKSPGCSDILFVEPEMWQWRLLDEYSLACYYTGNPEISIEKTQAIVDADFFKNLPDREQERLKRNLDLYKKGFDSKKFKTGSLKS
jgi:glycosyltransferase involved in cell wall biosynthesis